MKSILLQRPEKTEIPLDLDAVMAEVNSILGIGASAGTATTIKDKTPTQGVATSTVEVVDRSTWS